jgi:hypothetical protein
METGNNKFIVDLGELKLTDDQRKNINAAIQDAVTGELADVETGNQLVLLPETGIGSASRLPGHIIYGIIARPFDEK